VLSCSGALFEELRRKEFFGLAELPLKRFKRWQSAYSPLSPLSQARTIASSVAFNAMAFKTVHLLHPHAPALTCSTYLLDNKILHRKIREEGGAYGCGASYNALFGTFCLQSYRDPHIAETFQTFEKAIESVALGHFDKRDLEEAKLGVVQALDSPISPGSRGLTAYTRWREGRTIEMRQRLREELLALSEKDVRQAIDKELVPKKEQSVAISFAGKELLEQENAKLTHWRESFPILAI
ncbi:MAG: insulinase family protein, partial [Anaerolineae bacterium]